MSLFAKTFVLINACLTLVLTFLMSVLLVQKADYRTHARSARSRLKSSSGDLQRARHDARARTRHLRRQLARRRHTLATLFRTHAVTRQMVVDQRQTLASLSPELAGLELRKTGLLQRLARTTRRHTRLARDLTAARAEREAAVARRARLLRTLSQTNAHILTERQRVNALQKVVIELADSTQKLRRIVEIIKDENFGFRPVELVPLLDGKVHGAADGLVRIDLGRDQGVEIGLPFSVVRGKTYIGYLRVIQVRKLSSTARVVPSMSPRGRTVRKGDRVTTRTH